MTIPLPTPVPKVIMMKFFMPFATPNVISPMAAALASLVSTTGMPSRSLNFLAKGTTPFHGKLGASSMLPV